MFNGGEKIKNGSQQLIKETNIKRVFSLVSKHDGISRAEIANITKLSPTTISSLAEELMSAGFVFEAGRGDIPTSGRKPIMLKVNPKGGCIVSVDLQNDGYNAGCFDLNCCYVKKKFIALSDYKTLGRSMNREINKLIDETGYKKEQLLGICIGAPGIIDREKGRIVSSTIIPVDETNAFYDTLKNEFPGIKIEIMNESSLSAYTEKEFNSEIKGINDLIYIDIHRGIGAGIIINGKIYEGADALAGEFGHISIDINGPICKCGSRGCLEILASIPALVRNIEMDGNLILAENDLATEEEKFLKIAKDYRENGKYESEINRTAEYIAYGINNALNLMNPGAVVIGGKITALGDGFLKKVIEIHERIGLYKNKDTNILLSEYSGNPVTAGGAKHIFNEIF